MSEIADEVRSLLLTLWKAERKPGVRAWAIHVALTYAINEDPTVNKREIWKLIQDEYVSNLRKKDSRIRPNPVRVTAGQAATHGRCLLRNT